MNKDLAQRLKATSARYADRATARAEHERRIAEAGPLRAETPTRAASRVARLSERLAAARAVGGAAEELAKLGLERVLGEDDLQSVSFLEAGFAISQSVARVIVRSAGGSLRGYGTAFLVSPRLALTNHHVLRDAAEAAPSVAEFDFRDAFGGRSVTPRQFQLRPDLFFATNAELDCSLIAVESQSLDCNTLLSDYGWSRVIADEGKIAIGEKLNIIQHPGGQPKQVALRANELRDVLPDFLHYQTDTAPGSSGSPVFNDQWEVVALHHSGVPKRDEQRRILADDGTLWTEDMGEHRIAWISNEGVRISRILAWLRAQALPAAWESMRTELFAAPIPERAVPFSSQTHTNMNPTNSVTFTVPINVTISIGGGQPMLSSAAIPAITPGAPVDPRLKMTLADAIARFRENETRPYYDAAKDQTDRDTYYAGVTWTETPEQLYQKLAKLVHDTHGDEAPYKPLVELYPWIDMHPDRRIRSIYSGRAYETEEFMRLDLEVEMARQARLSEFVAREGLGTTAFAEALDALEDALPYNCEHVVPQSWFNKKQPMRGDLHHLFACESGCNSFRGNTPYFDFDPVNEALRTECGRSEPGKFEPEAGRGAVARATLYFLLRYPGAIGNAERELQPDRLSILLRWHRDEPPGDYEKHRNQAIFERQNNRNPLIDFPEKAESIAFASGFGGL